MRGDSDRAFGDDRKARTPAAGATVIPLYAKGSVSSLGVLGKRYRLPNGETMIYDVSAPTMELYRPASGRGNGTAAIAAQGGGVVALGYTFGGRTWRGAGRARHPRLRAERPQDPDWRRTAADA